MELFLSEGTLGQWNFSFQGGHLDSGTFPFRGDTWTVELFLSGGTLGQWAGLRGGKHSELRSPFFPLALPLSGHVAVLRCGMKECLGKCMYASVLAVHDCADETKNRLSLHTTNTAAYSTKPITSPIPQCSAVQKKRGQRGGVWGGETAFRNYECLPSPHISPLF